MIRISNIKVSLEQVDNEEQEQQVLRRLIITKLRIGERDLLDFNIFKKSIDARKNQVKLVYTVDVALGNEKKILGKYSSKGISETPDMAYREIQPGKEPMTQRPVIIGMGPAGLFAGLWLARNGYRPLILERGEDVDTRTAKIQRFWRDGLLDPNSNVQFGEGGAGTFSDGKLTTLINDPRCRIILKEFIKAGAPGDILYRSKPHVGTDILKSVVKNIRASIIRYGGEVRFGARVSDFIIKEGKLKALIINDEERFPCQAVLLGIGHSARDTFRVLHHRGVVMSGKPFSIGVRIEHPQEFIDRAQYGEMAGHPMLGAADYKLAYHGKNGRSAYTFCMCPGGYVVAAASEEYGVVTNGMSEYKRDGTNANAALLVGVTPDDYPGSHPLAGVEFQREWERKAYQLAGGGYRAPAQLTGDFLADKSGTGWGQVTPTYKPGVVLAPLKNCLPSFVVATLKEAILEFDKRIKGFAMPDSVLIGVETRSSSPVRINRDENHLANIKGLYPMGEGAGYAGGIMSSAVDGVKTAEKVMAKYAPW